MITTVGCSVHILFQSFSRSNCNRKQEQFCIDRREININLTNPTNPTNTMNNKIVRRLATASFLLLASTLCLQVVSGATAEKQQSAGKLRSQAEQALSERRYADAVSLYSQAIEIEPQNAANYYKLFRVHSRLRSYVSALTDITNAVEVDPNQKDYRFQKAKLLVTLGRCEEAVEQYKYLATDGNDKPKLVEDIGAGRRDAIACDNELRAAEEAFSKQNYREAKHLFDLAMAHMESAPDLLFMKAQCQYHLGDYFGVISDTGKILKVHKQNLDAYQLRGEAYMRTGDHDVAVQHFREGLKLDPEHKGCKAGHKLVKSIEKKKKRGDDALTAGKHADAVEYYIQAINIDETHRAFARPTLMKIARAYSDMGKHVEAVKTIEELITEEKTLDSILLHGDIFMAADEFGRAVNVYQMALDFEPNDRERETREKMQKAQVALKQSKEKNYYKILGLARTANKKEIKSAYRKLALEWHPDKNEDKEKAEKMFQDISEAYEVLSDEELKGKYDRGEDVFDNQGGGGGGNRGHGFPEQMFRQHFQHGGQGGGRRHHFNF